MVAYHCWALVVSGAFFVPVTQPVKYRLFVSPRRTIIPHNRVRRKRFPSLFPLPRDGHPAPKQMHKNSLVRIKIDAILCPC